MKKKSIIRLLAVFVSGLLMSVVPTAFYANYPINRPLVFPTLPPNYLVRENSQKEWEEKMYALNEKILDSLTPPPGFQGVSRENLIPLEGSMEDIFKEIENYRREHYGAGTEITPTPTPAKEPVPIVEETNSQAHDAFELSGKLILGSILSNFASTSARISNSPKPAVSLVILLIETVYHEAIYPPKPVITAS